MKHYFVTGRLIKSFYTVRQIVEHHYSVPAAGLSASGEFFFLVEKSGQNDNWRVEDIEWWNARIGRDIDTWEVVNYPFPKGVRF